MVTVRQFMHMWQLRFYQYANYNAANNELSDVLSFYQLLTMILKFNLKHSKVNNFPNQYNMDWPSDQVDAY